MTEVLGATLAAPLAWTLYDEVQPGSDGCPVPWCDNDHDWSGQTEDGITHAHDIAEARTGEDDMAMQIAVVQWRPTKTFRDTGDIWCRLSPGEPYVAMYLYPSEDSARLFRLDAEQAQSLAVMLRLMRQDEAADVLMTAVGLANKIKEG